MCSPLFGDDVNGAEEKNRPDDVVEDNKAQERHQDPQWDTHHLQTTQTCNLIIVRKAVVLHFNNAEEHELKCTYADIPRL